MIRNPDSQNWRSNLMSYLYNNACGGGCITTQEVEVFASPEVTLTVDDDEICEEESGYFFCGVEQQLTNLMWLE